jgi:putative transposase
VGTDATASFTQADGAVTIFASIDHYMAECVGLYAVNKATRFKALEPVRQGVHEYFGRFAASFGTLGLGNEAAVRPFGKFI